MLVASDLDGTIDAAPDVFAPLFAAIRQAGHQLAILTGVKGAATITPADVQAKQQRLAGYGIAYDQLAVFPDDGQLPQLKAQWCQQNGVALLIDNDRGNAQAAQARCLVLVPWATRTGKKSGA